MSRGMRDVEGTKKGQRGGRFYETNGCVYINFAHYTMYNVARHPGSFIKPYITIAIMVLEGKPE